MNYFKVIIFLLTFVFISSCTFSKVKNDISNGYENIDHVSSINDSVSQIRVAPNYNLSNVNEITRFKIEDSHTVDSNNIKHFSISVLDTLSKVSKTINVFRENPFSIGELKIIPNESPFEFYFVQVPGGSKGHLKKYFGQEVYDLIPEKTHFEKLYVKYSIDFSTNKYLIITYTLDLDFSYEERGKSGFTSSISLIYNSVGRLIHQHTIDGSTSGKPVISEDGKYLAYLKVNEPAIKPKKYTYSIVDLEKNKEVYSMPNEGLILNLSFSRINLNKSLIEISLIYEKKVGLIMFFDYKNAYLYKSKNNIPGLHSFKEFVDDYIEIYYRNKPSDKLIFEKDFELIKVLN